MDFLNTHLLSLILFLPTIAALVMLFLPSGETKLLRWFAFGASLIPFVLTLVLWSKFRSEQDRLSISRTIYVVRSHPLIPPPRRGRYFSFDGFAYHITYASRHPRFVQRD